MNNTAGPALLQALALYRAPRSRRPTAEERLPEGILKLLRIVAGEEQASIQSQEACGESREDIREAAAFYIQQVMFAPDSDSYRVLGVDADAGDEQIKEHYRWLTRWLHPDRNRDPWEAVFADRVNQAWQDLRTPERRLRYDRQREESAQLVTEAATGPAMLRRGPYLEPVSPAWNLRWLPAAVFAGLGGFALFAVALFYALQWTEAEPPTLPDPEIAATTKPPVLAPIALAVDPGPPAPLASLDIPEKISAMPLAPAEIPAAVTEPITHVARSLPVTTLASAAEHIAADSPRVPAAEHVSEKSLANSVRPVEPRAPSRTDPPPRSRPRQLVASVPLPAVAIASVPAIPSSAPASAPTSSPSPSPNNRMANRILASFSKAYEEGSLTNMRAMMAEDVRGPRGGLNSILAEYDGLFGSSKERSLLLRDVSWFTSGETLTIIASYQAMVVADRGGRQRRTHGDLRLDLRRENEQWRIYRLRHDAQGR